MGSRMDARKRSSELELKRIRFKEPPGQRSVFDVVSLQDLLQREYDDHSQFDHHRVTFYVLLVITKGSGKHSVNFQDYTYKKGTVFTIRPENVHQFHRSKAEGKLLVFTEDVSSLYVGKKHASTVFNLFNEHLTEPKMQMSAKAFDRFMTFVDLIEAEHGHEPDSYSMELISSMLHILLTHLRRIRSKGNSKLSESRDLDRFLHFQKLVEQHCQENRKVADYAEQLHVSTRTLNNITNKIVGRSAKSVINDILIARIKRLLVTTDLNIGQVAFQVGFEEASHMFKFFKKNAGQTPKEFRDGF